MRSLIEVDALRPQCRACVWLLYLRREILYDEQRIERSPVRASCVGPSTRNGNIADARNMREDGNDLPSYSFPIRNRSC